MKDYKNTESNNDDKKKGKIMTEENDENISITFKNVIIYVLRYYGFSFIIFSEIA